MKQLGLIIVGNSIIHPCDPTVVIRYLIWSCNMAVHITYLISHSSSVILRLLRIFYFGCIINTKLCSCVDIICRASLSFPSWCPESTHPTEPFFQGTSWENLIMYYINTLRWFCIYILHIY